MINQDDTSKYRKVRKRLIGFNLRHQDEKFLIKQKKKF